MSSPFPAQVMQELIDSYGLQFNTNQSNDIPEVELTADDAGLHIYGPGEAVVEFLLLLGHAAGRRDLDGANFPRLVDLSDRALIRAVGSGDVEVQLPTFVVEARATVPDAR